MLGIRIILSSCFLFRGKRENKNRHGAGMEGKVLRRRPTNAWMQRQGSKVRHLVPSQTESQGSCHPVESKMVLGRVSDGKWERNVKGTLPYLGSSSKASVSTHPSLLHSWQSNGIQQVWRMRHRLRYIGLLWSYRTALDPPPQDSPRRSVVVSGVDQRRTQKEFHTGPRRGSRRRRGTEG